MAKYYTPVYPSDNMNTKGHWAVGIVWPVIGSKGDEYSVVLQDKGWECDCPARVKCKHIKATETAFLGE